MTHLLTVADWRRGSEGDLALSELPTSACRSPQGRRFCLPELGRTRNRRRWRWSSSAAPGLHPEERSPRPAKAPRRSRTSPATHAVIAAGHLPRRWGNGGSDRQAVVNLLRTAPSAAGARRSAHREAAFAVRGARIAYVGDATTMSAARSPRLLAARVDLRVATRKATACRDARRRDPTRGSAGRLKAPTSSIPTSGVEGPDEEAEARTRVFAALSGRRSADGALPERPLPPLPPRPPRRGGERRSDRRPAKRRLAPGREPNAHRPRRPRLADGGEGMMPLVVP